MNKSSIIHVEPIISDPEKNTCYSSPTYGMPNEIGHHISEPSRLANSFFLYHDKLVPLLRDGQGEKATTEQKKQEKGRKEQHKKGEQKQYYTCGTHYLGIGKKYMLLTRLATFYRNRVY